MARGKRRKDESDVTTRENRKAGGARSAGRVPVNGGEASPELDHARQMARIRVAGPRQKSPSSRRPSRRLKLQSG
jgi:hypothetical protein